MGISAESAKRKAESAKRKAERRSELVYLDVFLGAPALGILTRTRIS